MATLWNKRKFAAVARETQLQHPREGQSRNMLFPRINDEYITQVFEKLEGRVTKKLFQFLGALSDLNELLLNPQVRTRSVTVP